MVTFAEAKNALGNEDPNNHIEFNNFTKKAFGIVLRKPAEKQEAFLKKHIEKGTFTEQDVLNFIEHMRKVHTRVLHKFGNSAEEIERMEKFIAEHNCGKSWVQEEPDYDISPVSGIVRCVYEYK